MRPELAAIVDALVASSETSRVVSLDALGEALGARKVSGEEIEAMIDALERAGRTLVGGGTGSGVENLRAVLLAARALGAELGRRPTQAEIAERSGLSSDAVRHALALAKIMQR